MDRPPLYNINTLIHCKDETRNNFEYYMNREYAYNRDKGNRKICGKWLNVVNRHCHRVEDNLPLDKMNKGSNLAWLCKDCDQQVHGMIIKEGLKARIIKKIEKYRIKLA